MTKLDVIKSVARVLGAKNEATAAVCAVFDSIRDALRGGEKVVVSNFGTFRVKPRRPRRGRNPKTGAEVSVPPRKGVRFKASKGLLAP